MSSESEREALAALIDPDSARAGWGVGAHDVRDQINGLHVKRGVYRAVDRILAAGFRRTEVREPSTEDYESRKLRALGGGESEALCPDCRGELTSWFCDRCSNTGLIKREPQGEPSDAVGWEALLRAAGEVTS